MLRIEFERQRREWSRAELARRARMAASDVGKIEAGRLVPYASQLAKLARALGPAIGEAERLLDAVTEEDERQQ